MIHRCFSGKECQKLWKALKRKLSNAQQKARSGSGAMNLNPATQWLINELSFLGRSYEDLEYVNRDKIKINQICCFYFLFDYSSTISNYFDIVHDSSDSIISIDDDTPSTSTATRKPERKRKLVDTAHDWIDGYLGKLEKYEKMLDEPELDPFSLVVDTELKKLSNLKRAETKVAILQLLFKAQSEDT